MKSDKKRRLTATLLALVMLQVAAGTASAHRVNVFAWVEGDTVYVESKFSGGKKVTAGKIIVLDAKGVELLSGLTDDQGSYSFKVPGVMDLIIRLVAGQGHQAEWMVRASEMTDLPSEPAVKTSAHADAPSEKNAPVTAGGLGSEPVAPGANVRPEQLEAMIEDIMDRKLKPLVRMVADLHQSQDAPTFQDVFAGIGYILGLVGIAAYVHSRKKRD